MTSQKSDIERYKSLANVASMDMKDPVAGAIYRRMHAEGAPVRDMRAAHLGMFMAPYLKEISEIDIALVGVPLENSIPLQVSTAQAPDALREWSQWQGPVHPLWRTVPFDTFSAADYGNLAFKSEDLPTRIDEIEAAYRPFADAGINTLSVGGEHTLTLGVIRALAAQQPLGLLMVDAHSDTGGGILPWDHTILAINDASPFRYAVMEGLIDPKRCVQIGIRGRPEHFWEFGHEVGIRIISAEELEDRGVASVIAEALEIVGKGPAYLSIDNDGIDPAEMPATGLPEPFGVSARDTRRIIRAARCLDIVGADFVELSPANDPTSQSTNIGAALCFEMLCVLSEARTRRTDKRRQTKWNRG